MCIAEKTKNKWDLMETKMCAESANGSVQALSL